MYLRKENQLEELRREIAQSNVRLLQLTNEAEEAEKIIKDTEWCIEIETERLNKYNAELLIIETLANSDNEAVKKAIALLTNY